MTLVNLPENSHRIPDPRQWCAYCFGILDPEDRRAELRKFVQCTHCKRCYHAKCWRQSEQCVKCDEHDAVVLNNLLRMPAIVNPQPVYATMVKPSAIFYYVAGIAYEMPTFVLEKIIPEYEYWKPRIQAALHIWHAKALKSVQNGLIQIAQQLRARDKASPIGEFIQTHLATLTPILVYIFYAVAFMLVWLLLRTIF